jgi:hypothetical protein
MIYFRMQKSCMRCQWHHMHKKILLGSPFKFIYIFSGGVGPFGNIYMFLMIFPLKAARAVRIVCRACMLCHILHTIAVLHMIFNVRNCSKNFCACIVNDTTCTMHAMSMTPHAHVHAVSMILHAPCMR